MKRKMMMSALMLGMTTILVHAQTQYDAERFTASDLNGTARFVGMGGAMGALGGDISTMGTNPAGIGLFRRNDVSATLSLMDTKVETDFQSVKGKDNRSRLSFDQAGIVISNKFGNETSLRYVNFGVNYRKQRNFNKSMTMFGDLLGMSLTDQVAWMANTDVYGRFMPISIADYEQIYNELDGDYYSSQLWEDVSWLTVLGMQGGLIGPEGVDGNGDFYYIGMPGYEVQYESREKGGVNAFDFNLSANINEQVYLGMTVGFHDVNYDRSSYYSEVGEFMGDETFYQLENSFKTEGTGVDAKFGIIVRPIEESAFRFGLAVHTPTYYKLSDRHSAKLTSSLDDYWGRTDVAEIDYELQTPWKFNFSLGHTIGTSVALGAEYEYADYSSVKLRYDDGVDMEEENDWISEDLKGVHTFRLGVEAKLIPEFSVRAGYNYSTAAFEKGAYKWLYPNDTRTDTEYENMLARNVFTVGLGYRIGQFYIDAAYQYTHQKSEFYPFDSQYSWDAGVDYPFTADGLLPATEVKNERNQFMMTLGYRF